MSKINLIRVLVLGSIVGVTVFFALQSRRTEPPRVGDIAPDFTLPELDGRNISLRDFQGRVVVLNFWATWCPPCVEEMPSLKIFSDQMKPLGVTVLGVSVDYDADALNKFVARTRLDFPIAHDMGQRVSSRYGTFKYPETYIIDAGGKLSEKLVGPINWQDERVMNRVQSLAAPARPGAR